jgi:hypothetical protein
MKKFAVIVMCALAALILVSASPAPAADPGLVIEDFEGKVETNSWKGGSSSITVAVAADQFHSGAKSLKVEAAQKDYCGFAIVLPAGKTDWTGYATLKFWSFGTASGTSYNVYVEEAKGEQFLLGTVKDDVAGWKEASFAFADAKSRGDYQAATATVDKVLQMQMLTLQMAPNPGSMTFFVDDISLAK